MLLSGPCLFNIRYLYIFAVLLVPNATILICVGRKSFS
uniref:Uncharacterized protein n=1 Tax=Arundo donax TaxID=35708 RepID=A0A0A9H0N4_ARUDO